MSAAVASIAAGQPAGLRKAGPDGAGQRLTKARPGFSSGASSGVGMERA